MMPPGGMPPTKEQVDGLREMIRTLIQIKKDKRKGIALKAKAEVGELNVEIGQLTGQLEQLEEAAQALKSASGLVIPGPGGGLRRM